MKTKLLALIKLALVAALVWWLVRDIDWMKLWQALISLHPVGIALTLLAVIASDVVIALRWYYLSRYRHPFRACFDANMLAFFFNTFVPAKLGDLAKIYYLSKRACIDPKESSAIFVIERFFDVVILGFMVLFSALYAFKLKSLYIATFALFFAAGLFLFAIYHKPFLKKLVALIPFTKLRRLVWRIALLIAHNLSPARALTAFGITLVMWAFYYLCDILFFCYATDFDLSLLQIFTAATLAFAVSAIPLTPGGIGTFQAAFVLALGWYGVAKEDALGASSLLQLLYILPATLYSLYLFITQEIVRGMRHVSTK